MIRKAYKVVRKYYSGNKVKIIAFLLGSLAHRLVLLLLPLATKEIVDRSVYGGNPAEINSVGFVYLSLIVFFVLVLSVKTYTRSIIDIDIKSRLKSDMFHKTAKMNFSDVLSKDFGYFIQRMNVDTERMTPLIISEYANIIINGLYGFSIIVIMTMLDVRLASIVFFVIPVFILSSHYFKPIIDKLNHKLMEAEEKVSSTLEEGVKANLTIKANNMYSYVFCRFNDKLKDHIKVLKSELKVEIIYDYGLVVSLMNLSNLIIYWVGGLLVVNGHISIGSLIAFNLYFSKLWNPIEYFMALPKKLRKSFVSLERVNELLDSEMENHGDFDAVDNIRKIEAKGISHAVGSANFKNFSLLINEGERILINGENGVGKSTFVKMLVGLIQPTEGSIFVNSRDIRTLDLVRMRDRIRYVPQESFVFSDTIAANIGPDALHDEVLEHFTDVNQQVVSNNTLSGGEKKIIQLLRGLNTDAEVVILDEPFAFIDDNYKSIAKKIIMDRAENKTLIVISHLDEVDFDFTRVLTFKHDNRVVEVQSELSKTSSIN